jgi:hypothetical protein
MEEENDNSGTECAKEVIDLQAVADDACKRIGEAVEAAFLARGLEGRGSRLLKKTWIL